MFKLLIVKKNIDDFRKIINWKKYGFMICSETDNGIDAFEIIKEKKPHLVITDMDIFPMGGMELVEQCVKWGFNTEFVVMSTTADFNCVQRAINLGVSGYLMYPVNKDELIDTLDKIKAKLLEIINIKKIKFNYFYEKSLPISNINTADFKHLNLYEDKLYVSIESGNKEQMINLLSDISGIITYIKFPVEQVKAYYVSLVINIMNRLTSICMNFSPMVARDTLIKEIYSSDNYIKIEKYVLGLFSELVSYFNNITSDNIIKKILFYIDENYSNNIKLESLAFIFNYNSAYLGKLFKKQVGMLFNSYLDKVRIEKATKLLLTTNLKNHQISAMVGFNEIDCFYYKFNKYIGTTPKKFKSINTAVN